MTVRGLRNSVPVAVVQGKVVRLQIWDSAGQENYRSITRAYYRSSVCAILVFDVSNRKSFEDIKSWLEEATNFGSDSMYLVLLGNKCELGEGRSVSFEEGSKFARDHGMLFFEVSAITGLNVMKSFTVIVERVLDDIRRNLIDPNNESHGIKTGMNTIPPSNLASLNIKPNEQRTVCCFRT